MLTNMVVWSRLAVKYHKSVTFVPYGHVLFHNSYSLSHSLSLLSSFSPFLLSLSLSLSPSLPPLLPPSLSLFLLSFSLSFLTLSLSHTHITLFLVSQSLYYNRRQHFMAALFVLMSRLVLLG